jgi:hypothetical protein
MSWTSHRGLAMTAVNHAENILAENRAQLGGHTPWSCAGLNRVLWARPHLAYGLTKVAFRNTLSALRHVLIRLGVHADSSHCRNKLSPAWQALHVALPTDEYRKGLIRFFRFLTLEDVTPETMTPDSIDQFDAWCRSSILHQDPTSLSRRTAGNWEFARRNVLGWPQVALHRTGMRDQYALPWEAFPASFRAEVERFLAGLAAGPATFKRGNPFRNLAKAAEERASGRKTRAASHALWLTGPSKHAAGKSRFAQPRCMLPACRSRKSPRCPRSCSPLTRRHSPRSVQGRKRR